MGRIQPNPTLLSTPTLSLTIFSILDPFLWFIGGAKRRVNHKKGVVEAKGFPGRSRAKASTAREFCVKRVISVRQSVSYCVRVCAPCSGEQKWEHACMYVYVKLIDRWWWWWWWVY
ncbi:hypothetical protein CMV_017605 [Castanea mollissima]|uniref:Uncharacterized protein n=1 Tax=Castanea mollissima TaxID=60419 RepID=A0A8J4QS30_9ROSI|nr:hypothetical protein CMV_017605 [Castanea mollissima]